MPCSGFRRVLNLYMCVVQGRIIRLGVFENKTVPEVYFKSLKIKLTKILSRLSGNAFYNKKALIILN